MTPNTVVFDVNETLLDLAALDPLFEHHLGAAGLRRAWFAEMLITAMTLNHISRYESFAEIGRACLATTAAKAGKRLPRETVEEILDAMRMLSPHPDVVPAFERLAAAGFRLVALTNSPPETAQAQLEHAGLGDYFMKLLTVADAGRLKPARAVYAAAAERLGKAPGELMLVAAHTWDLAGAAASGWATAFVARGGQVPHPLYPLPDLVCTDLQAVATMIVDQ
ncbi:MAG: haloacid dehalogenase type II [Gammaproteobacteria bacterium]